MGNKNCNSCKNWKNGANDDYSIGYCSMWKTLNENGVTQEITRACDSCELWEQISPRCRDDLSEMVHDMKKSEVQGEKIYINF